MISGPTHGGGDFNNSIVMDRSLLEPSQGWGLTNMVSPKRLMDPKAVPFLVASTGNPVDTLVDF